MLSIRRSHQRKWKKISTAPRSEGAAAAVEGRPINQSAASRRCGIHRARGRRSYLEHISNYSFESSFISNKKFNSYKQKAHYKIGVTSVARHFLRECSRTTAPSDVSQARIGDASLQREEITSKAEERTKAPASHGHLWSICRQSDIPWAPKQLFQFKRKRHDNARYSGLAVTVPRQDRQVALIPNRF
ncbi:hypothetical protein EVAR_87593_1 [Eumeta japonica]|uniref:Uncharacterized protein n=1 Tax=Eumeta variegata TaxID=151549 RepID=A0A4C1WLA0_EUMVA|nr:hypothetical protein EVAR_87593_1 [Eumeta japonica]